MRNHERTEPPALFIPLKRAFYLAFKEGTKTTEFRPNGPRWNAKTCTTGRRVTLSMGYGIKHRLAGVVTGTSIISDPSTIRGWEDCYGAREGAAIAIHIRLTDGLGVCRCGKPFETYGPNNPSVACPECNAKNAARQRRQRAARKALAMPPTITICCPSCMRPMEVGADPVGRDFYAQCRNRSCGYDGFHEATVERLLANARLEGCDITTTP